MGFPVEGHPAIVKAIKIVGSERRLAKLTGWSRTMLYLIRIGERKLTAERALVISQVTGNKVRKHELRPDLW